MKLPYPGTAESCAAVTAMCGAFHGRCCRPASIMRPSLARSKSPWPMALRASSPDARCGKIVCRWTGQNRSELLQDKALPRLREIQAILDALSAKSSTRRKTRSMAQVTAIGVDIGGTNIRAARSPRTASVLEWTGASNGQPAAARRCARSGDPLQSLDDGSAGAIGIGHPGPRRCAQRGHVSPAAMST